MCTVANGHIQTWSQSLQFIRGLLKKVLFFGESEKSLTLMRISSGFYRRLEIRLSHAYLQIYELTNRMFGHQRPIFEPWMKKSLKIVKVQLEWIHKILRLKAKQKGYVFCQASLVLICVEFCLNEVIFSYQEFQARKFTRSCLLLVEHYYHQA